MHIELELDNPHAEQLLTLQKRLNKPLQEIVKDIITKAIEENAEQPETEGEKILNIMQQHGLLGCMEGDGTLATDYKKHLWGNQ